MQIVISYHFRAKKRVDAGGPCLGVNGRPSVLSNKSLDDLKRTATLRDLGQNSFTEVQLMDALTKRIVAEQKAARCASSSDESSDELRTYLPAKLSRTEPCGDT